MSTVWKNNSPNVAPFQSSHNMLHTYYGPVPNFSFGNRIAPGQTPSVNINPPPGRANAYGVFSQLPGLLQITTKS